MYGPFTLPILPAIKEKGKRKGHEDSLIESFLLAVRTLQRDLRGLAKSDTRAAGNWDATLIADGILSKHKRMNRSTDGRFAIDNNVSERTLR